MNKKVKNVSRLPLVSIITCVFNGQQYISDLFESVINLDYPNIEHIIVDDGSTDNTPSIVEKYSFLFSKIPNKNLKIKYVRQTNKGLGDATNTGLKNVNGKYWTWINCDDWYSDHSFKKIVKKMEKTKSDVCLINHNRVFIDEYNGMKVKQSECFTPIQKLLLSFNGYIKKTFFIDELKYTHFFVRTCSFDTINPKRIIPGFRYTQDVQLYAQLLLFQKKIIFDKTPIVNFRIRKDNLYSVSQKKFNSNSILDLKIKSIEKLYADTLKKRKTIETLKINELAKKCLFYAYRYDRDNFLKNYFSFTLSIDNEKCFKSYIYKTPKLFYYFRYSRIIWKVITHYKLFITRW